jgi:hypothetical protein
MGGNTQTGKENIAPFRGERERKEQEEQEKQDWPRSVTFALLEELSKKALYHTLTVGPFHDRSAWTSRPRQLAFSARPFGLSVP